MAGQNTIHANLPITESTYIILLSLSSKPKHGYAIMKDVRILSNDRIILSTGTLYGALKRLLEQGWITRADDSDPEGASRDRKVYALSRHGQRKLEAEIVRLQELLTATKQRVAEGKI